MGGGGGGGAFSSAYKFFNLYQKLHTLVFVNYAHLSKKLRNYDSIFYFKFGKTPTQLCNQVNGKDIYPICNYKHLEHNSL